MTRLLAAFLVLLTGAAFSAAQEKTSESQSPETIAGITSELQKIDGFVPLYYDEDEGKVFLEISRLNEEFLYQVSLATGIGSNPIGLDRGQLGETRIVFFERAGDKILLVQPNYRYRGLSDDPAERLAVQESFARSVIWGFKIRAAEENRILVDATSFLIRDAHGVADRLNKLKQGNYSFEESRSALYPPRTRGFPKNTEVEATITLVSKTETGRMVDQTVPSGDSVTVRERHSFVELPDAGYRPREFDPRTGAIPIAFYDYAAGINENLEKRWIIRHRLKKKDPLAVRSEAVNPIVYYVDNGAPKAVRDALIEGASWWNQAFEAAGFINALQVKVLPPDADPLDVRYNVINWVHRSTRGWAYGNTITDPRTGEIIKGDVTLDSQRARQDFMIGSALSPQFANASIGSCDFASMPDADYLLGADSSADAVSMSLARIRQLSAHEVGHTLGFTHNFAASTFGRGSVMDYPAPLIEIREGKLEFSNAYAVGIGEFDKFAVQYSYTELAPGTDEKIELGKIVRDGIERGMLFISDDDARPASAAQPLASLWDNGNDPVANLRHEMLVRRLGLKQFGLRNVAEGIPLSELENQLLPLYLHHRYQLRAAVKSLGGVYYTYAVRTGDSTNPKQLIEIVPAPIQRAALQAVLDTIKPEELAIPENILNLIPPTAYGFESQRSELFPKRTKPVFDPIGAADIAAGIAIGALLEPNRAARLITLNARDISNPGFAFVVDELINATWRQPIPADKFRAAILTSVQNLTVAMLIDLAANPDARTEVRSVASSALRQLAGRLKSARRTGRSAAETMHYQDVVDDIEKFLARPALPRRQSDPLPEPPGDPIGSD